MQTIRWRKSSHSGDSSNCVEIATTPAAVLIRDSKNTSGPALGVSLTTWAAFLAYRHNVTVGATGQRFLSDTSTPRRGEEASEPFPTRV
ncbi:DUF397 domain-containing protein [Streptomyces sp. I5]|uniref:DUF397 domain-containing protein n=1 Tax=Streptomyces sp. I5 TaxID=2759947 RepID=UPI0018EE89E8|nr:DUF397 domain-containing protein [Streptomyces sp. I5]MBJ6632798.1 DUF397 domain-containing protein [Streptomyces sp. I5]